MYLSVNRMSQDYVFLSISHGPVCTNKPQWPWPVSLEAPARSCGNRSLSSAQPWAFSPCLSYAVWLPVSSSTTAMPVCYCRCWSGTWLPSLTLDNGPAWRSVVCVWSRLLSLDLVPTCGVTSQLDLRSAASPWTHLMICSLGWTSPRSACSPRWGSAGPLLCRPCYCPQLTAALCSGATSLCCTLTQPANAGLDSCLPCHCGMNHLLP